MIKKIILLLLLALISTVSNFYAQCTGCNVTNPVSSGNYTFASGSTVCFTSNATLGDVTFENNSKICVAPGVTVTIQYNVNSAAGNNITFEIGGTLQFIQSININANLTTNIQSNGLLKAGSTGNNNFSFNGSNNTLNNSGTMQVNVLQFQNSGATNIVDNYGILTISSNINIQGNTTFRNFQTINIGDGFNSNATSTYINCGTINSKGFNLGGGRVINTGNFNVSSGSLDLPNGSRIENYGAFSSGGNVNNNGVSSIIYNEGLFTITNYGGVGWLRGPDSSSKKGYFETVNQMTINSAKVGPNLDFKRTSGASTQATVFNTAPTYVTSTGTTTTQAGANVSFDCRTAGNCTAPLMTNIVICPNIDGTFPPQANDDAYTIAAGSSATANVLANDFAQYNGAAATTSNVIITQVSTTYSGVNVNTSGVVSVAAGTPVGTYTIVYRICSISNTSSCDSATVTVTVSLDSDGDGVLDSTDLDDDNDGILDTTENPCTSAQVQWMHNADGGQSDFATYGDDVTTTSPHFTSASNVTFGAGLDETTDNYAYTYLLRNATATTFAAAKTANDYAQVSYTPNKKMFLNGLNFGFYQSTGSPELNINNFKMAVEYSTSATFTSPTLLLQDVQIGTLTADGYTTVNNSINNLLLQSGTTYYFRIYFYDEQNTDPNNRVRLDDLYFPHCLFVDTDNDGIEDYLDLDSDNDGCADALEGSEFVRRTHIHSLSLATTDTNYPYRGQIKVTYNGTTTGTPAQIISTSTGANGVPQLVNVAGSNFNSSTNPSNIVGISDNTDGTADIGQDFGSSKDALTRDPDCDRCFRPATTAGTTLPTNHGITALARAGGNAGEWPVRVNGAYTVLDAKTKGFVINRVPTSALTSITGVTGMMVYDTTVNCLKIYDGTSWNCYTKQTCNDSNP